jgi:hypothetical protein
LVGLDAVVVAAEGGITKVNMTTRKPPHGLLGAPYLEANGTDITGVTEPQARFVGTAREARPRLPANLNVAAALAFRDWTRLDDGRDLGRPEYDAEYAPHRGRGRPLVDVGRERAFRREPAHRAV